MSDDIIRRAKEIMHREPVIEKTADILASFAQPLNSRAPLEIDKIDSTHGTNFAAIVQALRNANGQLVPHTRLTELGIRQRTGESSKINGSPLQAPPFVSVGLLRNGLSISHYYALIEAGYGNHIWGKPTRKILSEASNIPSIAIGELLDPEGKGRALHEEIFVKNPTWVDTLPKENPLHGKSYQEVGEFMDNIQNLGERLNIRALLVWDPEEKGQDELYFELVKKTIELISQEQKSDYTDIAIIMIKELTGQQKMRLTINDIARFMKIKLPTTQRMRPCRHFGK